MVVKILVQFIHSCCGIHLYGFFPMHFKILTLYRCVSCAAPSMVFRGFSCRRLQYITVLSDLSLHMKNLYIHLYFGLHEVLSVLKQLYVL